MGSSYTRTSLLYFKNSVVLIVKALFPDSEKSAVFVKKCNFSCQN